MIGLGFQRLDPSGIVEVEAVDQVVQNILDGRIQRFELFDRRFIREVLQPPNLHQGAVTDECGFGEIVT